MIEQLLQNEWITTILSSPYAIQAIEWAYYFKGPILFVVLPIWLLWIAYVAIMHIRRVRDKWGLTIPQKVFGYPLLIIGFLLDVFVNAIFGSIVFVEAPQEKTLSARLERHREKGSGWRFHVAKYIQEKLLADFDLRGSHGNPGREDS